MIRVACKPRRFPEKKPAGPAPAVDAWREAEATAAGIAGQQELQEAFEAWTGAAMEELCEVFQIPQDDWARYGPRTGPTRLAWARPSKRYLQNAPQTSPCGRRLHWLAERANELGHLRLKEDGPPGQHVCGILRKTRRAQWHDNDDVVLFEGGRRFRQE